LGKKWQYSQKMRVSAVFSLQSAVGGLQGRAVVEKVFRDEWMLLVSQKGL
jgi:hypothetical protein